MNIAEARLCLELDCQTIYSWREHKQCPKCASREYWYIGKFINPPAKKG